MISKNIVCATPCTRRYIPDERPTVVVVGLGPAPRSLQKRQGGYIDSAVEYTSENKKEYVRVEITK